MLRTKVAQSQVTHLLGRRYGSPENASDLFFHRYALLCSPNPQLLVSFVVDLSHAKICHSRMLAPASIAVNCQHLMDCYLQLPPYDEFVDHYLAYAWS